MAKIDKLKIRGVRSFGPSDEDALQSFIRFTPPITCIVGQNGCGKTTIIEALRYATTGNVPPCSDKGKSFIYDPKLSVSGGGEVKGQVRLQFYNVKGEKMQVTRTLQVTRKLGKMELKTVDPMLHLLNDNTKPTTLSGRSQDVKQLVLNNLGVSEAILDNVIFCHQDDSLWPLDEGKKLKEKFDEIFDAAKYNKASDSISKIVKKKQEELKLGKQKLTYLRDLHDQAKKKKDDLNLKTSKYAEGTAEQETLEKKLKPYTEEIQSVYKREKQFLDLQSKIAAKETEKKSLEVQQRELRENISELYEGSKEELKAKIKNFHAELKVKKDEIAELEGKRAQLLQQDRDSMNSINKEQTRLGKLQQEEETRIATVQDRQTALKNVAAKLNLHGLQNSEPSDRDEMLAALKQVEAGVRAKEKELQALKQAQQQEEKKLQKDIDEKREQRSEVTQKVKTLETQVTECREQLRQTKLEISQVDKAQSQMTVLKTRLERADKDYEFEAQKMNCGETQDTIKETQDRRDRTQDEVDALNAEVELLQQSSSLQAEADVHRSSLNTKEAEIKQLKEKHQDELKLLFGSIPERGLQTRLESAIKQNEQELKDMRVRLEKSQKQQTKTESELQHIQQKVEETEKLLATSIDSIKKECEGKNFDTTLSELEESMRKAQDQKGVLDSSDILFRRYTSTLKQRDPCCPLCHRDFKAAEEAKKLISELQGKMDTLPAQKAEVGKTLEELKARHSRLLQLKPTQAKITQLQATELPKLKDDQDNSELYMVTCRTECEQLKNQMKVPENKLTVALALRSDVALLEKYEIDVKNLTKELQRIELRLPNIATGRTLAEAQDEQKLLRSEVQRLQREAEDKQRELDAHQKRVAQMREDRNALKEELLKVQAGAQKRAQLLDRSRELTTQESQLSDDLEVAQKAVAPKQAALDEAERAKQRAQEANNEMLERQRKELTTVQGEVDKLKSLNSAVEAYEVRGLTATLAALRVNLNNLQETRERLVTQRQEITNKIDQLSTDVSTQTVRERELGDNLRLLEKKEQCEIVKLNLDMLFEELGSLDYVTLMARKDSLTLKINAIHDELNRLKGTQTTLQDVIQEMETELEKACFKHAAENFKRQMVKNEVMSHVIKDLLKFFQSLNQSMIHFHTERMNIVNGIIRELWVTIYKGSDIDYITIKTDSEQAVKTTASSARRTYNYRVVMVKKDTELDMRGRCSAGQKMLACLVIRIALAETFSNKCGILALDEPTTNLDHANIQSLCTALTNLVRNHRIRNNFQLLVITHDEDFIERLTQEGLMDHFYRISRDDRAHSQINRFRVGQD